MLWQCHHLADPFIFCPLCSTGSPMTMTVDGSVFEALLPNMIPGKTYQVTVSAVKGLEESDPSTDTVTTGWLSSSLTQHSWSLLQSSWLLMTVESVRRKFNWSHFSWHRVPVCALQVWTDLRAWLQLMSQTPQPCCCGNPLWPLLMATSSLTVLIQVCLRSVYSNLSALALKKWKWYFYSSPCFPPTNYQSVHDKFSFTLCDLIYWCECALPHSVPRGGACFWEHSGVRDGLPGSRNPLHSWSTCYEGSSEEWLCCYWIHHW